MLQKMSFLVVAALLGAALLSTASRADDEGALPSQVLLRDGPGDVWQEDLRSGARSRVGAVPTADVTRARVVHGHYAVRVRMWFVDLRRAGSAVYTVRMLTGGRLGYALVDIEAAKGQWRGSPHFSAWWNDNIECTRLTHGIDYAADVVTIRIPRNCLRTPSWVRVRLDSSMSSDAPVDYYDNPHNHRFSHPYTERLHRG